MANRKNLIVISDATEALANVPYPGNDQMGIASVVSRTTRQKSARVLTTYSSEMSSYREKYQASEKIYNNCVLVQRAIDMFIDIIFHKLIIRHPEPEVEVVIRKVFEYSNIEDIIEGILLDYYLYGNAFPYRFQDDPIEDPYNEEFKNFKPYKWINLDPTKVDVDGENITDITYTMESSSSGGAESPFTIDTKETLDPDLIYHIFAKKTVRQRKANPPFYALARPVDIYNAMMDAAMSNMEDNIPGMIHFKVGGLGERSPKSSTISKITNAVSETATRSILVTSDVVQGDVITVPPVSLDPQLYAAVVEQIEFGLGVSKELVTSSVEGGGSLQWFNITKMIKTMEGIRRKIQKWIDHEVRLMVLDLQKQNLLQDGLTVAPIVALDEIILRDETYIRDILLKMYEKGLVSDATCLEAASLDQQVELNRQAFEKYGTFNYDGKDVPVTELIQPPTQPFQGNTGGRPSNVDTTQEQTRENV